MCMMNCISVLIGAFFAYLIPQSIISIVVVVLFTVFGLLLLYKAYTGEADNKEDEDEIKEELKKMGQLREGSESLLDDEKGIICK